VPRFAHPRQHAHLQAAELPEEDVGQCCWLACLRVGVDVEDDRTRRTEFVVVVANDQHDLAAADVDLADPSFLDEPGQRAEADAVGGAPAGDPVGHPTRTDRVAVARLEVRAADRIGHGARHTPDLDK
jgi:hypothetical protein